MRVVEPEPWALGMRFQDEPQGLHRYVVAPGLSGRRLQHPRARRRRELLGQHGQPARAAVQVRGDTELQAGDEVLALADEDEGLDEVFAARKLTAGRRPMALSP